MDSFKYPNPKLQNQSFLSNNSKGMIKFLLSFSVLSVFLSLKPFLMQLVVSYTTTVDKSYMFLLCNGLLVFVAMNSGLINPPSPSRTTDQSGRLEFNYNIVSQISSAAPVVAGENVVAVEENSTLMMIEQENVVSDENVQAIVDHEDEEERSLMMTAEQEDYVLSDSQEEDEEDGNGIIMIIDEDDHAAEELNKKCEDFIKKMKAAFCSEPRSDYTSYLDNEKPLVLAC